MRANREGSLYQRKSDGRFCASISLPNGKRKTYYGKTEAEALANKRQAERRVDDGVDLLADDPKLADFLTVWLESIKPGIRPMTYRNYNGVVENHLKPDLGQIRVSKLTVQEVQVFINGANRKKLAPRTVRKMRMILHMALEQAIEWGMVHRNVTKYAKLPRIENQIEIDPSTDNVLAILEAVKKHRLEAAFYTAVITGLRLAELLALQWSDLDARARTLAIIKSLQKVEKAYTFVELKTKRSRRILPVPDGLLDVLRVHRDRQAVEQEAFEQRDNRNLIFCSKYGTPLDGPNVTRMFQNALTDAGLPHMRMHDLRHICLSILVSQGVDIQTVSAIAGHSNASITLNTYSHVVPGNSKHALDNLDALLAHKCEVQDD